MSPGLTSQVQSAVWPSALLPFPSAVLNINNNNNDHKNPAPEGAPGSACGVGAPTELCFMHHRLISTDNIPADPRSQSCRLREQNFSPSSPRRLIPGFTSSVLRKFNCNLGLDEYSYYKRLVQLDNLILVQGVYLEVLYRGRKRGGKCCGESVC